MKKFTIILGITLLSGCILKPYVFQKYGRDGTPTGYAIHDVSYKYRNRDDNASYFSISYTGRSFSSSSTMTGFWTKAAESACRNGFKPEGEIRKRGIRSPVGIIWSGDIRCL